MRAPAKAAITMTKDETASTYWINTIIVIATMSFDPEEIPRVKGLAIGLPKNTCIRNPDSARPPPRIADVIILGNLIFHIMLYAVSSPSLNRIILNISFTDICTLPELILSIVISTNAAINMINTALYLAYLFIFSERTRDSPSLTHILLLSDIYGPSSFILL